MASKISVIHYAVAPAAIAVLCGAQRKVRR